MVTLHPAIDSSDRKYASYQRGKLGARYQNDVVVHPHMDLQYYIDATCNKRKSYGGQIPVLGVVTVTTKCPGGLSGPSNGVNLDSIAVLRFSCTITQKLEQ